MFPEHSFIASCLSAGLSIQDLKLLTYVDVLKILVSLIPGSKEKGEMATQSDIDNFLR